MTKGLEEALARETLMRRDLEWREAAAELDRGARSHGKRQRFPQGQLFDQKYQEDHAEELAERRQVEGTQKRARKGKARAVPPAESSNSAQRRFEATPTEEENVAWLASMADDL